MRVALIVPRFPQVSETFIVSKFVGLLERGLDVHVVCSSSPAENWDRYGATLDRAALGDRIHVVDRDRRTTSALGAVRDVASAVRHSPEGSLRYVRTRAAEGVGALARSAHLDARLVALAPDIVHFEFGALAVGREHLPAALDSRLTVSFRGYDLNYVGLDDPNHYDRVWASAARVHVLGEDLERRAHARGAPPTVPISRITPAVDASRFVSPERRGGILGSADRPVRLVSNGRLHWKKGYEHAIDAVARLVADGVSVEYRIIGDGPLFEAVHFWRHQGGLDDTIDVLGAVPPGEVRSHLEWADVFVHSAVSEGFCNAVLEAQASGLPVVCTDADGLRENVDNGVTGTVVPRRDHGALADAIAGLCQEPAMRRSMGQEGPTRVTRRFSLASHLDSWQQFYDDAMRWPL